jgi:tetratricopeptide (TPR) repeat protein
VANDSLEFVQRGKVSIVRRQYAEAVKICRLGLLGNPTLLEGRLVLGMALSALERWDEVLAEMRVALEIDPQSPLAWLLKGEALVGKGDYQQAEASLRRAKELDPSNTKADQLLSEIQIARAAGFEGIPAEPTDTKVYPARVTEAPQDTPITDPEIGGSSGDIAVEYEDEATEVDPDPSDQVRQLIGAAPRNGPGPAPMPSAQVMAPHPTTSRSSRSSRSSTSGAQAVPSPARATAPARVTPQPSRLPGLDDDRGEESSTDTFLPMRGGAESSYESPAHDDYAESARPRVAPVGDSRTPIDVHRTLTPRRAAAPAPAPASTSGPDDYTEPSIELSSGDLVRVEPSGERLDVADDEDEDERTGQRRKRQVDENAGTRPETPDPVRNRARPVRPFDPLPRSMPVQHAEPWQHDVSGERPNPTPGVVRVPLVTDGTTTAPSVRDKPWEKLKRLLGADRLPRGWLAIAITSVIVVIAVSTVTGLLVREWRMRARITKRHDLARQKLLSGNYPGFQAAELLYRQILTERDDPPARAMRARVLAQMAFEFGDDPVKAERAVAGLGESDAEDAQAARVYLAMARGELERAQRMAQALRHKFPDGQGAYLVGRAELVLERPETAVDALRAAAEREPRDPLVLHALGMAEAAAHRDDRAFDAYKRALDANANHIATLIDRAILQVRDGQPTDRESARLTLEGVVTKLVGDASPGQLARGFLGLAELALARGDLAAARSALSNAVSKRRDGDALLSEELARSFARAFELDQAEREAQRAMAGSSRLAPRLVLAEVALRRGRPKQALRVIEEAGTSRPEALVLRALAHLDLGSKDAARVDVDSALRVQPDLVAAKVALARVEIAEGHPERAQRELDRLERALKLPDVACARGEVFLALRPPDRERARFWFGEARRRDPLAVDARLALARLDVSDGRLEPARAELDDLLKLNPAYAPARRELAAINFSTGDAVAARDQFDALAETDADVPTLLGAARAHLVLGDVAGARERLDRADKLMPIGAFAEELADLRAMAALRDHQPAQAVALLAKLVAGSTRGETGALLMEAHVELEHPDLAARVRLQVPPRLRGSNELLVARARLAIERGLDPSAEALATAALERLRGPTASRWLRSQALVVLGRSQYDQGVFRPAQRSLKNAGDLDPMSARAFHYLGLVDEELGRRDEARAAIEQAVKNDPRYPDALYDAGRLRQAAGDARWREAFQQYLELAPRGTYADEARRLLDDSAKPTSSPLRKQRRGR